MLKFLYFSILFVNFLCFILQKNKCRHNKILLFISIFLLGIIFTGGIETADMSNYSRYYNTVLSRGFEITEVGFHILVWLCRKLNMGIMGMRCVVFSVSLFFMVLTLRKNCWNYHLYMSVYMLFSFYIYNVQLRNAIAIAIVMYAMTFLYGKNKSLIKYCLLIVLAISFHTASIFYFIFLLSELKHKKLWLRLMTLGIVALEIIIVLNGRRIPLIGIIISNIISDGSDRAIQYFTSRTNGSIAVVGLILLNIGFTWYTKKSLLMYSKDEEQKQFAEKIVDCSILQLLCLPLLWLNVEFYRFPRDMLLMSYIVFVNTIVSYGTKITFSKIKLWGLFIINTGVWLWIAYYEISDWNTIFRPFFYQNAFFQIYGGIGFVQ